MKIIKKLKCQKGQALAETAIVLPLLVGLFLGLLIFGLAINAKIVVVDAARDGARHYALNLGSAEDKVRDVISNGWGMSSDPSRVNVTTYDDGAYVKVKVEYKQPVFVPKLNNLFGGGDQLGDGHYFTLQHTATFKKEY